MGAQNWQLQVPGSENHDKHTAQLSEMDGGVWFYSSLWDPCHLLHTEFQQKKSWNLSSVQHIKSLLEAKGGGLTQTKNCSQNSRSADWSARRPSPLLAQEQVSISTHMLPLMSISHPVHRVILKGSHFLSLFKPINLLSQWLITQRSRGIMYAVFHFSWLRRDRKWVKCQGCSAIPQAS